MRSIIIWLLVCMSIAGYGQSNIQPSGTTYQQAINRLDILHRDFTPHTAIEASSITDYDRLIELGTDDKDVRYILFTDRSRIEYSDNAGSQIEYQDSSRRFYGYSSSETDQLVLSDYDRPLFNTFWKNPYHFYEIDNPSFKLDIDPIFHVAFFSGNQDGLLFENQRGLTLRALIDDKIYIQSALYDNQARYANYVTRYVDQFNAVPQAGSFKLFNSVIFDSENSYDYLIARGHLGVMISGHVSVELGHDRHHLGHGMRSLLLSDFSPEYFYLKLQLEVWKIKYTSMTAELTEQFESRAGDNRLRRKYMATHFLNLKWSERFSIGLFETVVFNRSDQFELQYLNPVILFRAVEGGIGSPDNVLIGLNTSYIVSDRIRVYGQLLLDEFKIDELIIEGRGWWANKFGIQLGAHYVNAFGVKNLDWTTEFNTVRPYTYTHRDVTSNYTHYNQPLAHPLGANFREWLNRFRCTIGEKWESETWFSYAQTGDDPAGENLGGNIFKASEGVAQTNPFGNSIAQGIRSNTITIGTRLSYNFWPNAAIDLHAFYRDQNSDDESISLQNQYVGLGVRLNFNRRPLIL